MVRDILCFANLLGMFIAFALIGYQLLNWLMEKEEEMGVNYERMKMRRMNETP